MKLNVIKSKPKDASAIIIYYKKKVLLNLRSNKKNIFYPNHWGLLGGAKENKENLRETAIREFEEETSVKIVKKNLFFFNKINFSFPNNSKKIILRNYYIYKIDNLVNFKKFFFLTEGLRSNFFDYDKIRKMQNIVPYDKLALDMFFSSLK
jgi:ADP-ribose pyrophosphatase YjhB (NUDIX family)